MQFESLKIFCDVARQRSFSEAATSNEMSQSAVSQVVNQLERRLGVKLVDRSRRPLQLTREGQVYYDGCKRLVAEYLDVEARTRNLGGERASEVRVAAIYSVGLRDMSQYSERFIGLHPGAVVEIEYLHPDKVLEKVLTGAADFGLLSFPQSTRKLAALSWRDEEMVLCCAKGHRFAGRRAVGVRELQGEKYVGFDRDLVIRRKVDRFLKGHGVAVDVVLEFDNIENIKQAIEISAGVALLPAPALRREADAGTLSVVPLEDAKLVRPLGLVHRRSPPPSRAALQFIELLRQPDEPGAGDGAAGDVLLHKGNQR